MPALLEQTVQTLQLSEFVAGFTSMTSNFTDTYTESQKRNVTGTYSISGTLCTPKSGDPGNGKIQLLVHGIGFDSSGYCRNRLVRAARADVCVPCEQATGTLLRPRRARITTLTSPLPPMLATRPSDTTDSAQACPSIRPTPSTWSRLRECRPCAWLKNLRAESQLWLSLQDRHCHSHRDYEEAQGRCDRRTGIQ